VLRYKLAHVGLCAALVVSACSTDQTPPESGDPELLLDGPSAGADSGENKNRLRTLGSADAFYEAVRAALIAQRAYGGFYGEPDESSAADAPPTSDDATTDAPQIAPALPASDDADSSTGSGGSAESLNVTSTNVQEVGVDESDIIKTDGEQLFILGSAFVDAPFDVPTPTPAEPVEIQSRSSFAPERQSQTLRILSLQPEAPDAIEQSATEFELGGPIYTGMYLYPETDANALIMLGYPNFDYQYQNADSDFSYDPTIDITRLDVSNPAAPEQSHHVSVDGQIVSSRRIGNQLFFASRHYLTIPDVYPYDISAAEWEEVVNNTDIATLMPQVVAAGSTEASALLDPASCFVAQQSENGYPSTEIISMVTLNLDTMVVSDSECYLGASETLYASPEAVYLATTRWSDAAGPGVSDDDLADGSFDPRLDTDIHQFLLADSGVTYNGSGTVTGHLGWRQSRMPYRMSHRDGVLRVVSHHPNQDGSNSPVSVSVLQANGNGGLDTIAEIPNEARPQHIGKPFEELYASRFIGDHAYLVTFRQIDPLYVIDLSTPSDPFVAGELEIEGYSDYLHPIGEGYLLGIGKDSVAAPDEFEFPGAFVLGVKLTLFNIEDAANPVEVQSVVVGQQGTHASGLDNFHGITVQAATEFHPTRVALGIDVVGQEVPPPGRPMLDQAIEQRYSGLHGFEIRVGADAGITRQGVMKIAPENSVEPYFRSTQDRSVLIDDATYYIYDGKVFAAQWTDLANMVGPR